MRVRFFDAPTADDRRSLKPALGDLVKFEGRKYKVTEVGLKYIRMVNPDGSGGVHVAKIQDVVKVLPENSEGISNDLVFNP